MLYERRIDSFKALIDEAASMDADAGLRILGELDGESCYAFVTRFGKSYTIMIYERRTKKRENLGRRVAAEEVRGLNQLRSMLRELVPGRVRAFAY